MESVSRNLLEVILCVCFMEHLEKLSECGFRGLSEYLPEFDSVFPEEACKEQEFLLFCDLTLKRTYVVQNQVFELIVTFLLSF